jgi:hypothetical protein
MTLATYVRPTPRCFRQLFLSHLKLNAAGPSKTCQEPLGSPLHDGVRGVAGCSLEYLSEQTIRIS